MKTHDIKAWPEYFEPVWTGKKTAELRRNDREYRVGDKVVLHEYEPMTRSYTGRAVHAIISHIVGDGEWLAPGYAMLSLNVLFNYAPATHHEANQ